MLLIFSHIKIERRKQDEQWGGPAHDDEHCRFDWLRFIEMYTAQANVAALTSMYPDNELVATSIARYEKKLIQIAALAVAAIQSSRRKRK
jgi:hypothetical protein